MQIIASWPAATPLSGVADWARRAERLGFDAMHVPETVHDPFTVAALALAATDRLVVRTSMVLAFPRSPMLTAVAAWDLARFSGGRFELGLASQVRGNIVDRYSTEWSEPVARLRDYVHSVRAIFHSFGTGEPLHHEGPHYRFTRLQPYFNPGPLGVPEHAPTIWTGGVNERMCRLGGEVGDGFVAHPTNSHPAVLRSSIVPALTAGARGAGRPGLPRLVAGPQPVTAPDAATLAEAVRARREELAFLYSTPAYRPQLDLLGLGDLGTRLSAMAADRDWSHLADVLDDEAVARLVPVATHDDLPDVLAADYAGLVDGLVLALPAPGLLPEEQAAEDRALATLVERCRAIAGRS